MKIVAFSDTHSKHKNITIPECDVAICAGDISSIGQKAAFQLSTNIQTCSVSIPQITLNTFDTTVANFSNGKTLHYKSSMGNFDILFTVS